MRGLSWLSSVFCIVMYVHLAVGENSLPPAATVSPNQNAYDYGKMLEEIGARRILQLQQQLFQLQQLQQLTNKQGQKVMDPSPNAQIQSPFVPLINPEFGMVETMTKRSPHQIQQRAVNQFKNCYFSPVQCVLLERRRRSVSSFA